MMRVSVILVTLGVLFQAAWISAKHIQGSKRNVGVYGGETIRIEEAPWIAQVFASEDTICAGTIVHPRFILTIDTCCRDNGIPRSQWKVQVGSAGGGGRSVNVQEPFKYTKEGDDYNLKPVLCLLKLEIPLKYNQQVRQVSLDEPRTVIENGTLVDFVAYGQPELNSQRRELRRAKLPIDDAEWCKEENKRLGGGQICAGNHEHNACAGDAGGALILGNNLIGVLSEATSDCYSNPSRFCRISAYRDWIRTTIEDHLSNNVGRRIIVGTDRISDGFIMDVDKPICHEEYDSKTKDNDICLLKLFYSIPFGQKTRQVVLPRQEYKIGLFNVTGWGLTEHTDFPVNELRQVTVPVVSAECCSKMYEGMQFSDNQICAGSYGHDACQGDSGGPLTHRDVQIGIASYGAGCGVKPGVYTKVANYAEWIDTTINKNL